MTKTTLTMKEWLQRITINMIGLFVLSLGATLGIICGLGASPFDVLQVGMTNYLPITIGQASQIIALIFLIYTWSKGVIPGIGTILNVILVGGFIDLIFTFGIQTPETVLFKFVMLFLSIALAGFGIVLSLKARIGVGTRDSFMEYLVTATNKDVNKIRSIIEVCVFFLGMLLGGPIGIGSIITALTLGHMITFWAKVLNYDFDVNNHYTFNDIVNVYKGKVVS
ncbi:YczE/YyaS/YitT family protein [Romboutsia sp.]|uniref:YczE/YyaS/YitT family protein n=1 Tax=Romboutsia sp. TaxID=1965302 RepID=UPI003F2D6BD1